MLKKLFFSTALFSIFAFTSQAQVYEKGNMIVDAYYGGPNGTTALIKTAIDARYLSGSNSSNISVKSHGPFGARFEYILTHLIGIGVNVNYASTSATGTTTYNSQTYDYKLSAPRFRVMPTFNLHLGKSKKFDPYFSFGLGYSNFKFTEKTSDPSYAPLSFSVPASFAYRAEFGMRLFFTDHIGLHVQFGIGGGPLVAGGLSFKF